MNRSHPLAVAILAMAIVLFSSIKSPAPVFPSSNWFGTNVQTQTSAEGVRQVIGVDLAVSNSLAVGSRTSFRSAEFDVADPIFGATNYGKLVTRCAISSASQTLTATNGTFAASDVGKWISVYGAGPNGLNLTTHILAVGGPTSITLSNAASTTITAQTAVYGHDSTAAFQRVLNFAATNYGGTFLLSTNIYIIAGQLQDLGRSNANHNAQLFLPPVSPNGKVIPTLKFLGPIKPSRGDNDKTLLTDMNAPGAVIWSILPTVSHTNYASVFDFRNFSGNGAITSSRQDGDFNIPHNFMEVMFEKLTVRCANDSGLTALNLMGAYDAMVKDCMIDVGFNSSVMPKPLENTNSWGVIMPGNFNALSSRIENTFIIGYYNSTDCGANIVLDYVYFANACNAITAYWGGGDPNFIRDCSSQSVTNFFAGRSDRTGFRGYLTMQNTSGFPKPILGVDPSGSIWGDITYAVAGSGSGTVAPGETCAWVGTMSSGLKLTLESYNIPPKQYTPLSLSNSLYLTGGNLVFYGDTEAVISFGTNVLGFATTAQWKIYNHGGISRFVFEHTATGRDWLLIDGNGDTAIGETTRTFTINGTGAGTAFPTFGNSNYFTNPQRIDTARPLILLSPSAGGAHDALWVGGGNESGGSGPRIVMSPSGSSSASRLTWRGAEIFNGYDSSLSWGTFVLFRVNSGASETTMTNALILHADGSASIGGSNKIAGVTAKGLSVHGNVASSGGYISLRSNLLASVSVAVGASPFNWTNTSGVNINIFVDGVSVTGTTAINGDVVFNTIGQNTIPLQPNEYITIAYTIGSPTMKWRPR